jgi:hypothetical protein
MTKKFQKGISINVKTSFYSQVQFLPDLATQTNEDPQIRIRNPAFEKS